MLQEYTNRKGLKTLCSIALSYLLLFNSVALVGHTMNLSNRISVLRGKSEVGSSEDSKRLPDLATVPPGRLQKAMGRLPFSFEANQGQVDRDVKFLSRGDGYSLFLTQAGAVLRLRSGADVKDTSNTVPDAKFFKDASGRGSVLRMEFIGAKAEPRVEGLDQLPGAVNYLTGKDPKKWRTGVATYSKVRYHELYPGVDLIYYGNGRELEYDFMVSPGTDPAKIKIEFKGAKKLSIDSAGDMLLRTSAGEIRHRRPRIYQEVDGRRQEVTGGYFLRGENQVGFSVGAYNRSRPLVIDPVIAYSTYLGGSTGNSSANGIAVYTDPATGKVYAFVAGGTNATDFLVKNALQPTAPGGSGDGRMAADAFITKLDMSASGDASVVYSTYIGGSNDDEARGIAVGLDGCPYIAGNTRSYADFPLANSPSTDRDGVFVAKLNAAGTGFQYSMVFGGAGDANAAYGIAVDPVGNAYVAGSATRNGIPVTPNAFQMSNLTAGHTAFVTKIAPPSGSETASLAYSTYLGGSSQTNNDEAAFGIAVSSDGTVAVTGITFSTDFPIKNAYQTVNRSICGRTAFISVLDPTQSGTSSLIYSTYFGGTDFVLSCSGGDEGKGIAVDAAGNLYVTGHAVSTDFPTTPGALKSGPTVGMFAAKFNPRASGASSLVYSTYLEGTGLGPGGGNNDGAIAVDSEGNAYVTGSTPFINFPLVNPIQNFRDGVFQSIDGGASFDGLNKGLTNPYVTSLAIDTSTTPRTLYAGTPAGKGYNNGFPGLPGGIFKSTDGGASWSPVNNGLTNLDINAVLVNPVNASIIYAGTTGGIFRSADGGGSWSPVNAGLGSVDFSAIRMTADANTVSGVTTVTLYVATDLGLYKMVDGSGAWSTTGITQRISCFAVDSKASPHVLYATVDWDPNVYKSTDGGASWTVATQLFGIARKIAIDTSTTTSTVYLLVDNDFGNYGYNDGPFMAKSTDGGLNWAANPLPFYPADQSTFILDQRTSPSTLYFNRPGGVLEKSIDDGITWVTVSRVLVSTFEIDRFSSAPVTPLYIVTRGDLGDAFVAKLNPTGSSLLFSTYFGGIGRDFSNAIALDSSGNIYLAGSTESVSLPVANAVRRNLSSPGNFDAFITKLGNPTLPTSSAGSVTTEMTVANGTLELTLPNIQSSGTQAPTVQVEPLSNDAAATLTVSNNLGAYEISVSGATVNTTGYDAIGCTTDGGSPIPCLEKYGIKIAFSVPVVNDPTVFNNLVISHGEDTDNNPATPVVLMPYNGTVDPLKVTYHDFTSRTVWVYVPSLSPFVIVKGAGDQISDLVKLVTSFNLKAGIANSLDAKLQNAVKAYQAALAKDRATACNQMNSFISEVQAQTGKALTQAQTNQLILAAKQIKVVLGCH